jgi:hypothetical protein
MVRALSRDRVRDPSGLMIDLRPPAASERLHCKYVTTVQFAFSLGEIVDFFIGNLTFINLC